MKAKKQGPRQKLKALEADLKAAREGSDYFEGQAKLARNEAQRDLAAAREAYTKQTESLRQSARNELDALKATHLRREAELQRQIDSSESTVAMRNATINALSAEVTNLRETLKLSIEKSNYPAIPPLMTSSHTTTEESRQRASMQ